MDPQTRRKFLLEATAAAFGLLNLSPPTGRKRFFTALSTDPKLEGALPVKDLTLRADIPLLKQKISQHEGCVLHPYADRTGTTALIGVGFNLMQGPHGSPDDAYRFNNRILAEFPALVLWEMAGVSDEKWKAVMQQIAVKADGHVLVPAPKDQLPTISNDDADQLLDISVRVAIHNAAAYFRHFNTMTKWQQMGAIELVYQMGTKLATFNKTLAAANADTPNWKTVRDELQNSDWARDYATRARAVIAEFDPEYTPAAQGKTR